MSFDLISLIGSMASIVGISARDFFNKSDKNDIKTYITFLEKKKVLYAEIDRENRDAVIKSIEAIKYETERLRAGSQDKALHKLLGNLVLVQGKVLEDLWSFDQSTRQGQMKMFLSLQKLRTEMARTLAILCEGYGIHPSSTELQALIVNMATVRPHNK